MWSQITNVTDGRTDGRHAIPRPRKCIKVHCAVKTLTLILHSIGPVRHSVQRRSAFGPCPVAVVPYVSQFGIPPVGITTRTYAVYVATFCARDLLLTSERLTLVTLVTGDTHYYTKVAHVCDISVQSMREWSLTQGRYLRFYRAMPRRPRYCHGMLSVRLSVTLRYSIPKGGMPNRPNAETKCMLCVIVRNSLLTLTFVRTVSAVVIGEVHSVTPGPVI